MNQSQMDLDRVEAIALRVNKRMNAVDYRLTQLEELIPQLQEAALELAAALSALKGEDASPKKGKRSSRAQ